MAPSPVAIRRTTFATSDVGEAHEVLTRLYGEHQVRMKDPRADFTFRQEMVAFDGVALGRLHYAVDVDLTVEPLQDFLFVQVISGQAVTRAGRDELRAVPGDLFLNRVDCPLANTCRDLGVHTLRLDRQLMARTAAAHSGADVKDVRFESMTPLTPDSGHYFRDTIRFLQRLLAGPDEPLHSPIVIRSAVDLVAAAALAAFPHTLSAAPHLPGPDGAAPPAVRRATAFIEEHAGEPITPAQIAAAAGIGTRALQAGFRRHLDTTPTAYLRRARLDGAHRDLAAADASRGDAVTTIARRWGYVSMSRFAADYRAAYGRAPSHTLRD